MTEFRSFTKADWLAFSGCRSEEPLIAEQAFRVVHDKRLLVGDIILDGVSVQIHFTNAADAENFLDIVTIAWGRLFPSEQEAKEFAEKLLGQRFPWTSDRLTAEGLERMI